VPQRRRIAATVVTLAIAAYPAAALAQQGAGDEQYQDPFAGQSAPKKKKSSSGPSPWAVIGAALATGYVLAKVLDWRGHAHPRL